MTIPTSSAAVPDGARAAPWIILADMEDVLAARERVRVLRRESCIERGLAFELQAAVSELARSLLLRAPRNSCLSVGPLRTPTRRGLRITAEVYAPAELKSWPSTPDQFAREQSLPRALYLIKSLVDELDMVTLPGGGTRISAVKWLDPTRAATT